MIKIEEVSAYMRKVLFLFSILLSITLMTACNDVDNQEEAAEDTITPVEVKKVKKNNLTVEQTILGHVTPAKQTPVVVQQPGKISEVKVKSGDTVKKNDRLATIQTEMGHQAITAPVDGKVGQLRAEKDDFHNGEDPFAIIFDDQTVSIQFTLTADMKDKFKIDKTYKAKIDGETYDAEVKRIENLPNEAGQYEMLAQIDNETADITLGSVAELAIEETVAKNALIVPTEAIVTEGDEHFVFVVKKDQAKKIAVDLLETQTEKSAIKAKDIKEKDQVIVTGQFLLTDESKVDVVKDGK